MRPYRRFQFLAIGKLDFDVERLAITHDVKGYGPAGRSLAHHALELLLAFHRRAVKCNDYIMLFKTSLARRRVLIHLCDFHSTIIFELERLDAIGADIGHPHA